MSGFHRREIVDGPFDRTLWSVIEALVREGFVIRTTRGETGAIAGRRTSRQHVLLEATHPHVHAEARKAGVSLSLLLPCRIAVYELGAQQSAVVVPDAVAPVTCFPRWQQEYPMLAAVAEDADDRLTRALETIAHRQVPCTAVA
jgi:hypothetical protein